MSTKFSERNAVRLYRYPVASADIYHCEVNQREIFICDDPVRGFRIWGEIPDLGSVSAVNLCQIFLEYAMYCQTWRDSLKARQTMQSFAKDLGIALANYFKNHPAAMLAANIGVCALECILESMDAHFTVEQIGSELNFTVMGCPVLDTARRSGLLEVELAHYGVNMLCQSLIRAIDPNLVIHAPENALAKHIYSIGAPVYA
ncbi:MAG: hypothetical protein QME21_07385 [Anaerolineales bacterium]|nr:hypothetical protein [Anaerolineales bacterium]